MDSEDILRKQTQMYALVAEMESIKAIIESMKADGGYSERSFLSYSQELQCIAQSLRELL